MPYRPILALITRFVRTARQQGFAAAFSRGVQYVRRRFKGQGSSVLPNHAGHPPQALEKYLHGIWQTLSREEAFHIVETPAVNRNRRQIAMIADLNLPQCRKYRVEQLAAFWRERDVEFDFAHYQDVPRATRIMQSATHLMEYRLLAGPTADMLRYEARRLRLPILYDLDDPLFSVSAYETYRNMEVLDPAMKAHFVTEAPKYLSMMNGADVLTVSTPGMAELTRLYTRRPVFVRRNFADGQTLKAGAAAMKEHLRGDGKFRVAFASGSQGHEADLKEIVEPLADFILEKTERRLMIIGHFDPSHFPKALTSQIERVSFAGYEKYLANLSMADCAVMPLCDDQFNRCKSAVRVIDASAVGVPSVVGTVGDLAELVHPEETGFVAQTPDNWVSALRDLAADPKIAQNMGLQARRNLEARWRGSCQPHIIAPEILDWVEA